MKNRFEIRGDEVVIFLNRKDGTTLETTVLASDLPLLFRLSTKICPVWNKATKSFYANFHISNDLGKESKKALHRYLMGDPKGMYIDHINNDTLDNVTNSQNMQNVKGLCKQNKSGYQNVQWHEGMKKWRVRLHLNKAELLIGYFEDVHEAGRAAALARKKYYTHSKENMSKEDELIGNKFCVTKTS